MCKKIIDSILNILEMQVLDHKSFNYRGLYFTEKVYQIIAVMGSKGPN
jgi:hypothetical protein